MSKAYSVSLAWSSTFRSSLVTCLSYFSLSAGLRTRMPSGSGHRNKNMLSSLLKWQLHKPQSSSISAQKPKSERQGDASQNGLGFFLLQEGESVTYAGRALIPAEQRYSQIEKELIAQVFGLEHNHHYTFGRRVILWTDHKPLITIYKKPLASAPKRLQRLLLRLQQYDVDLRYRPGSEMYLADTLSRAFLKNTIQSKAEEEAETIHATDFLPISEPKLREIQAETAQDDTLQQLKKTIISGWPDSKKEAPTCLHPYFLVRDELSAQDGLIFKGQRCVTPLSLRTKIKEKLHGAHTGIHSCLRRA